jgi:hypothetical protein
MSEKSSPKENDLSNLFLEDSDDIPNEENIKNLFTSTESSEIEVEKKVKPKKEILIATTGMSTIGNQISDDFNNDDPNFIDNLSENETVVESIESKNN